ncbi:unnamed protein product [Clavelina lepadiformis]|uniref:Uncharacterized protein n=1 Tax=Clavelina lepadiformis TaxID=159417 RepID=A0ABP0G208_CLALP
MADWSMTLRSGCSLLWRRGFESRFCQRENLGSIRQDGRLVYDAAFRLQSPLETRRENLGSIRQDGRVVYGAAFRSQSPLEARVRIPLLSERKPREYQAGWPSGLWRCVQFAVSFGGAGSNPASVRYNFCSASILLLKVRFHSTLYLLGRRPASSVGRALDS